MNDPLDKARDKADQQSSAVGSKADIPAAFNTMMLREFGELAGTRGEVTAAHYDYFDPEQYRRDLMSASPLLTPSPEVQKGFVPTVHGGVVAGNKASASRKGTAGKQSPKHDVQKRSK